MIRIAVVSICGAPPAQPVHADFGELGGSIGRAPERLLVLRGDTAVSRLHAEIRCEDGVYRIERLGMNVLAVNGTEIAQGESAVLNVGDHLIIGHCELRVLRPPEPDHETIDDPFAMAIGAEPADESQSVSTAKMSVPADLPPREPAVSVSARLLDAAAFAPFLDTPEVDSPRPSSRAATATPQPTRTWWSRALDRLLGRPAVGPAPVAAASLAPEVDVSVFVPRAILRGSAGLVQVAVHPPQEELAALPMASDVDPAAPHRSRRRLELELPHGTRLRIRIEAPGLGLDPAERELVWTGDADSVQFCIEVPAEVPLMPRLCKVHVDADGLPVGVVQFAVPITATREEISGLPELRPRAHRYARAYIAAADEDAAAVSALMPRLAVLGMHCEQDSDQTANSEAAVRALRQTLENSDVVLLLWSAQAARSEAATKQGRHGLEHGQGTAEGLPELRALRLDNTPAPLWLAQRPFANL